MAEPEKTNVPALAPQLKAVLSAEQAFKNAYGLANPEVQNTWTRESMFALQAVKGSDLLMKCSPESIKNAVINIALVGATLNPALKEADLIPRKGVACLDFRYSGLIRIAVDAGAVLSMNAYVVYDCDEFDYDLGKNPPVTYKPSMNPPFDPEKVAKDPAEFWKHIVCAISRAVLPSGIVDWQVLPKWKLLKVRETSMSKDSNYSPWKTWPEEMIRKTVIKYAAKTLKGYSKNERLERAVQMQNDIDGLDLEAGEGRDTGAELEKRLGAARDITPEGQDGTKEPVSPDAPLNASSEGLTGSRLAFWSKCGEMAGGEPVEMGKIASNLSGGKITSRESLITAADIVVQEAITKMTGGKKP